MNRLAKALVALAVIFALSAVICAGVVFVASGGHPVDFARTTLIRIRLSSRQADLARAISTDTTPLRFTINSGDTPRAIGANLVNNNLITDSDLFVDYVQLNDIDVKLQAGIYFLNRAETIPQIAVALTDSRSSQFPFRILEGWRIEEIANVIDKNPYFGFTGADFLKVVGPNAPQDTAFARFTGLPAGASLEGFLFPDTYQLPATVTPEMLRNILTQQFIDEVGAQLANDSAAQSMTLYQAVTLASIVQREAVNSDEDPRIASVYRNRMAQGMKLDADPTVQYGIGLENGTWWPQITQADYTGVNSPYNTYLNTGLPPGPISNPGIAAIRAAIHPETTPYIYFRAKCDGSGYHNFATTFDEHVANAC